MAFVFYTNDYMIAGVLPEVATGLRVSLAGAGQLVTAFSLTIAVVAPLAAVALARLPRRRVFALALIVFVIANASSALATSFGVLVALRILAAAAAAAATPALHAFAARIAPPGKRGKYTAIVTLAVTGSLAGGVPLGTWIGGYVGWHAVFGAVACAGSIALLLVLTCLPSGRPDARPPSFTLQFQALTKAPILLGLVASCTLMCGTMMLLTYFAPYLDAVTDSGLGDRALALGLSGVAGMAGVVGGGLAVDHLGAEKTLRIGIIAFVITMFGLWSMRFIAPAPFPLVLTFGIVWGIAAFWNAPAIQMRLYGLAGALAPQALAMNTSSNFLGVSIGGALGGVVISRLDATQIPLFAALFGAITLLLLVSARRETAVVSLT